MKLEYPVIRYAFCGELDDNLHECVYIGPYDENYSYRSNNEGATKNTHLGFKTKRQAYEWKIKALDIRATKMRKDLDEVNARIRKLKESLRLESKL